VFKIIACFSEYPVHSEQFIVVYFSASGHLYALENQY